MTAVVEGVGGEAAVLVREELGVGLALKKLR